MAGADDPIDCGGQPAVRLDAPDGASAIVLLHGAQVVSWRPASGGERLFLSERARFGPGASVRGGMPVIFPQFNVRGPLPRHGFARNLTWQLARCEVGTDDALCVLQLTDEPTTRALWPHAFALELTACVRGDRLDVELAVTNTGDETFEFIAALHTYLRVGDIGTVQLLGLQGAQYLDFTRDVTLTDQDDALRIYGETDRIYFGMDRPLRLRDGRNAVDITIQEFRDVVVWNPGRERSAPLQDMTPDGYRNMLCVEAALIEPAQALAAGESWTGLQSLTATTL
jgi:glucose-6-phosphate 1-epimerase